MLKDQKLSGSDPDHQDDHLRKRAREEVGRKETAVDARYFRIAEDHLYGELAVALDMSRENVESYINTSLQSV